MHLKIRTLLVAPCITCVGALTLLACETALGLGDLTDLPGDASLQPMDGSSDADAQGTFGDATPSCTIGGHAYASATPNPTNACQTCQPTVSSTSWSNLGDGTACGGGENLPRRRVCRRMRESAEATMRRAHRTPMMPASNANRPWTPRTGATWETARRAATARCAAMGTVARNASSQARWWRPALGIPPIRANLANPEQAPANGRPSHLARAATLARFATARRAPRGATSADRRIRPETRTPPTLARPASRPRALQDGATCPTARAAPATERAQLLASASFRRAAW